jgi:hypothetical protein
MGDQIQALINEVKSLTKEIKQQRRENQSDVEQEAKNMLAHYLEVARAQFDKKYDEPEDEPRELDDEDSKDKKIIATMTKMVNTILDPLLNDEESEDEDEDSDNDEEEDADKSESDEEDEEQAETDRTGPVYSNHDQVWK